MKKELLYLDTSVISAYYDNRDLVKQELTRTFWEKLPQYEVYISRIVHTELSEIREQDFREKVFELIKDIRVLEISEEEILLSAEYINNGVIPQRYENDALQIALAATYAVDYVISWNFEHLVKVKTRRMVNLINLKQGVQNHRNYYPN